MINYDSYFVIGKDGELASALAKAATGLIWTQMLGTLALKPFLFLFFFTFSCIN